MSSVIGNLLRIVILSVVVVLPAYKKIEIFNYFTKAFSVLITISLFSWILYLFGFPFPSSPLSAEYPSHNNHIFFITLDGFYASLFPRFQSVFLEPGHLGMISSFLLFINKYNLKNKYVLVIFIGTLFTFSLAAYILMFLSVLGLIIINSKKPILYLFVIFISMFITFIVASNINNGSNIVNDLIIKRLIFEDGTIQGWNRFSHQLDLYYSDFLSSEKSYFGIGFQEYTDLFKDTSGNAGYKVFIVTYGIIGTLIVFLFYISMLVKDCSRDSILLFFLFAISFIQRAYATWDVQMLIFITGLAVLGQGYLPRSSFKLIKNE